MKQKPWLNYLLAVLLIGSVGLFSFTIFSQFSIADSIVSSVLFAGRGTSKYDRFMRAGYNATRRRQYSTALRNFRDALRQRPGDRYARRAISNVKRYIRRSMLYRNPIRTEPRRRGSGGIRSDEKIDLIPLMPTQEEKDSPEKKGNTGKDLPALFLTTAKYPSFFFYIPQIPQEEELLFELEDEKSGNILYELTFKPPQKAGIISITLPKDKPPLEANKEYRWRLSVDSDNSDTESPEGLIKFEPPSQELIKELQGKPPSERIELYEKNEYWEDALRIVADLRRKNPEDELNKIEWENLLATVNLKEDIVSAPLLPSPQ